MKPTTLWGQHLTFRTNFRFKIFEFFTLCDAIAVQDTGSSVLFIIAR